MVILKDMEVYKCLKRGEDDQSLTILRKHKRYNTHKVVNLKQSCDRKQIEIIRQALRNLIYNFNKYIYAISLLTVCLV